MIAMGIPDIIFICWLLFAPNGDVICICNNETVPTRPVVTRPQKPPRPQIQSNKVSIRALRD